MRGLVEPRPERGLLGDPHPGGALKAGRRAAALAGGAARRCDFLGEEGADRVRQAYGPANYERLVELKRAYDPTNFFRLNQNIAP
jgi:FAD/FMN-containing dehydrogenase